MRTMSDAAAVVVALAAAGGAFASRPTPVWLAALIVVLALALRRPLLLIAGVAMATSGLAARSWAGLAPPVPGPAAGVFTLLGDPHNVAGALAVDVRVGRRRVEAWARGGAAARLRDRLAGERVWLSGHLEPVPGTERALVAVRHVSGRLSVDEVGSWSAGDPVSRLANTTRRTLLAGAASLPRASRSLFAGFVLGDNRDQPPEVAYDFRAAGLAHLLVVSGENCAFVLALAAPALRRIGLRSRLVAGALVLGLFGTLTRWEPSVLRAVAMSATTLVAATIGRPASTIRILALSVAALLVIDPLLVHSVGFGLSVGACTGIALLSKPLAAALPGPRPIAEALAVTMAAQVGVAPVMLPVFGGIPVASLLANLVALPAAGPLMVWGLAAGLPAGIAGGTIATVAHLPTRALIAWVAAVARVAAALPLGELGAVHVLSIAAAVAVALMARRHRDRHPGAATAATVAIAVAGTFAVGVLALPSVAVLRPPPLAGRDVGRGAALWRSGRATVLVLDGATGSPDRLLSAIHTAGVRSVDVLVASRPGAAEARVAEAVETRFPATLVLAPPASRLPMATVPPDGSVVGVGRVSIQVVYAGDRLATTVTVGARRSERAAGGRGPPR